MVGFQDPAWCKYEHLAAEAGEPWLLDAIMYELPHDVADPLMDKLIQRWTEEMEIIKGERTE